MFTLLLALSLSAQSAVPAPAASSKDEAAVQSAQDARFAAMVKGDVAYLETALDASLTYHHSSGNAQTKEEFVKAIRDGALKYKGIEAVERRVRRIGAVAIITGVVRLQAINNGDVIDSRARFTDIYELKGGKFVELAWQSTRLPAPQP